MSVDGYSRHILDRSVNGHLRKAYSSGWLSEMVFMPYETASFISVVLGRKCMVCKDITKVSSASFRFNLPINFYREGTHFVFREKRLWPIGNPFCKSCYHTLSLRANVGNGIDDYEVLGAISAMIVKGKFHQKAYEP